MLVMKVDWSIITCKNPTTPPGKCPGLENLRPMFKSSVKKHFKASNGDTLKVKSQNHFFLLCTPLHALQTVTQQLTYVFLAKP